MQRRKKGIGCSISATGRNIFALHKEHQMADYSYESFIALIKSIKIYLLITH